MSVDLTGRVCLITGAAQGLGATAVSGFAQRGAIVIAADLAAPRLTAAAANMEWDVTQPAHATRAVEAVLQRFGRLDALVANAGIYPRESWHSITPEGWREVLAVNLDGAWHAVQAAAGVMRAQRYGKIVTVSSIEVRLGVPVHVHYDSAKAGVIGLTRSMARALGPDGIRVNCLMPGAVRTERELEQFPDQEAVAAMCDQAQCLPGRLKPEAVEPALAFLCSAESDAITGQVLCVDHGWIHY